MLAHLRIERDRSDQTDFLELRGDDVLVERFHDVFVGAGLHAGANEYIMKPFDKDIVTAKFQEVGLI